MSAKLKSKSESKLESESESEYESEFTEEENTIFYYMLLDMKKAMYARYMSPNVGDNPHTMFKMIDILSRKINVAYDEI